jgi:hypothetical protein
MQGAEECRNGYATILVTLSRLRAFEVRIVRMLKVSWQGAYTYDTVCTRLLYVRTNKGVVPNQTANGASPGEEARAVAALEQGTRHVNTCSDQGACSQSRQPSDGWAERENGLLIKLRVLRTGTSVGGPFLWAVTFVCVEECNVRS